MSSRVALRREHTGVFAQDQAQRLAQQVAQKANTLTGNVDVLANRAYAELSADTTTASATYVTLATANITTVLESGYLLIQFTASGVKTTNAGSPQFRITVDGVTSKGLTVALPATYQFSVSLLVRVAVTAGAHVVRLQWLTNTASLQINASSVTEEHAALLVQESAV